MKYLQLLLFFLFLQFGTQQTSFAQDKVKITQEDYANQQVEMADSFRADGKIYVVIAVILAVLGGMFTYLFLLDKKITELEKITKQS